MDLTKILLLTTVGEPNARRQKMQYKCMELGKNYEMDQEIETWIIARMMIGIIIFEEIFQKWSYVSTKSPQSVIGAIVLRYRKRRRPLSPFSVVFIVPDPAWTYHQCLALGIHTGNKVKRWGLVWWRGNYEILSCYCATLRLSLLPSHWSNDTVEGFNSSELLLSGSRHSMEDTKRNKEEKRQKKEWKKK